MLYAAVLHDLLSPLHSAHFGFVDYIGYFYHHYDKIPNRSSLKEERIIVDGSLRVGKTQQLERRVACGGRRWWYGLFTYWKIRNQRGG